MRILRELGQGWAFRECENAQTEVEANKLNIWLDAWKVGMERRRI